MKLTQDDLYETKKIVDLIDIVDAESKFMSLTKSEVHIFIFHPLKEISIFENQNLSTINI